MPYFDLVSTHSVRICLQKPNNRQVFKRKALTRIVFPVSHCLKFYWFFPHCQSMSQKHRCKTCYFGMTFNHTTILQSKHSGIKANVQIKHQSRGHDCQIMSVKISSCSGSPHSCNKVNYMELVLFFTPALIALIT